MTFLRAKSKNECQTHHRILRPKGCISWESTTLTFSFGDLFDLTLIFAYYQAHTSMYPLHPLGNILMLVFAAVISPVSIADTAKSDTDL